VNVRIVAGVLAAALVLATGSVLVRMLLV